MKIKTDDLSHWIMTTIMILLAIGMFAVGVISKINYPAYDMLPEMVFTMACLNTVGLLLHIRWLRSHSARLLSLETAPAN